MTSPVEAPDVWVDSEGWVHLHHPVTFGATRVANDPDVCAGFLARGWAYTPTPPPFVPEPVIVVQAVGVADGPVEAAEVVTSGVTASVVFHPFDASTLTVAQVVEAVTENPALAAAALRSERGGKNRASLIPQLEALAAGTTTDGLEADNG